MPKLRRRVSFGADPAHSNESKNEPICLIEFTHTNHGQDSLASNDAVAATKKDPFGMDPPDEDPVKTLKPSDLDSYFTKNRKKSILKPYDTR